MIVLVDGDIVAYRCAAGAENEEDWVAISRANNLVHSIIYESKATSALVYISGDNNFRKELCIEYKANRTKEKPKWLEVCREALVVEWGAKVVEGMEADDAIAIKATSNPDEYIMASLDKDFKQVPGWHYQWAFKGTSHGKEWVKEYAVRIT